MVKISLPLMYRTACAMMELPQLLCHGKHLRETVGLQIITGKAHPSTKQQISLIRTAKRVGVV